MPTPAAPRHRVVLPRRGLAWLLAFAIGTVLAPVGARAQSAARAAIVPVQVAEATAPAGDARRAGTVKRLAGTVTLRRDGVDGAPAAGQALREGDTLLTGPDGRIAFTLRDDTLLTLGPNSEFVLTRFLFDETTQDGQIRLSLWRGTLAMVTGLLGRWHPHKVTVETPRVELGVRGTEFVVDASGDPA